MTHPPGHRFALPRAALLAAGSLALIIPFAHGTSFAAAATSTASICGTSFDPYKQDAATLKSCGIPTYPVISMVTAADGSTTYSYDVEGDLSTYTVPPSGFDFASATPAQLAEYGVPAGAQLSNLSIVPAPPFLVSIPGTSGATSGFWSGWSTSADSNLFNTSSVYGRPNDLVAGCLNADALFWTGLGDAPVTGDLAQDGWAQGQSSIHDLQAWTEVLPTQGSIIAAPLYATAGYYFYMYVHHGGVDNNQFSFFMQNQHTGDSFPFLVTDSHYDGTTAEVIAEKDRGSLSNYGTVQFLTSSANGSPYPDFTDFPIYLYEGPTELAVPSGIGSSNGNFVDKWLACN
jgi:hypothetical protein